ncbi:hypothetical protein Htur_2147 [Haloterrigena turkmenica DSM 5511]|uniref:Halobacterial output domain-containing protein n=1 Tax=Haloterrigena turkmenica (strain ATCC 51198 / DSM 5511 / JCM 9101 / NCIMB 13204 / VKM B-1734 / 4k) TaxID=543526 RepID=D2RTS9_HALTV|nr:HalOD1 output domain-containing protein [Haloterrigena turkmenica]ADB61030.1 hypothetical protein Htur_2147 [Haloterrigena turkmenica DSM 5511]
MTSSPETLGPVEIVDSMPFVEFDADAERFRAMFDSDRDSASLAVVAVVAAAAHRDPFDLPPLHSAIDSSALEGLFSRPTAGEQRVSFRYEGFDVTVFDEGTIEANPTGAA